MITQSNSGQTVTVASNGKPEDYIWVNVNGHMEQVEKTKKNYDYIKRDKHGRFKSKPDYQMWFNSLSMWLWIILFAAFLWLLWTILQPSYPVITPIGSI